jgi:hypothetical protein
MRLPSPNDIKRQHGHQVFTKWQHAAAKSVFEKTNTYHGLCVHLSLKVQRNCLGAAGSERKDRVRLMNANKMEQPI